MIYCKHVTKVMGSRLCPYCGLATNEVDWAYQNQIRQQWIIDNPDAEYEGWMSI